MARKGREANMSEKLACALLALRDATGAPLVDREWAKAQTPQQIIALFEFDHIIYKTWDGSNHPTNIVPLIKKTHRHKTAKRDVPAIAKSKRLSKKQEEFRARLLAKADGVLIIEKPKRKASVPGSRDTRFKKKANGSVEYRW